MQNRRLDREADLPPAFTRLLIAWFSSLTADGMRFAAVPLLALTTNSSPAAVAAVAAAMALPWLLVALPAGVLVDRLDPARVIASANLVRAALAGLVVAVTTLGRVNIPLLCVVGFALTAAETFADSAAQTLLVRIVPSDHLERANARFVSSDNIGLDLVGPLLAGALFAVDRWLPFAVSAGIFAATAMLVLTLTGHREQSSTTPAPQRVTLGPGAPAGRGSVREGFQVIFADPGLRVLVITVAIMAAAIAAAEGVLVVYSTSSLRLPQALYPTLLASYSVGFLIAAGLIGRAGRIDRPGLPMVGSIGSIGVTLLVLGLFPHQAVAWACFLLMGAGGGVWNVLSATRRQRRTPRSMTARVSSTFRAISWGALPVGTALGGVIGQRWDVPAVFVVAGTTVLVLGAVAGPLFLRHQSPTPRESDAAPPR